MQVAKGMSCHLIFNLIYRCIVAITLINNLQLTDVTFPLVYCSMIEVDFAKVTASSIQENLQMPCIMKNNE